MTDPIGTALDLVGQRLRKVRDLRGVTLTEVAERAGISKSTLSRLDDLVGAPEVGDPRIRVKPRRVNGRTVLPLTRNPEFDTQVPHWFGSAGDGPAEVLSIFGRPVERMHARATPARGEER